MQVAFEFVDGPLAGKSLVGDSASERDEAASLYRTTQQGTVGVQFIMRSDAHRRAVQQWQAGEIDELGGPYEEYIYEVAERAESEAEARIRVKFVGKAVGGVFDAGRPEGLV